MVIPKVSRRIRKKQETKAKILQAARRLFEENGFEGTSVEEITERADVSKGTFFNHFLSKDALLLGIAEAEVADILTFAEEDLKEYPSPARKIRRMMNRLLEDAIPYFHLTGRVIFAAIINHGGAAIINHAGAAIINHGASPSSPFLKINRLLEELIREGQATGEFTKDYSPTQLATAILGAYYGVIFNWFEQGALPGSAAELEDQFNILWQGIENKRLSHHEEHEGHEEKRKHEE